MRPDTLRRRYDEGLTYANFTAQAEINRERFEALYAHFEALPAEEVAPFVKLAQRHGSQLHALALAEDWCGDAVRALPLLARLCEAVPGMDLCIQRSGLEANRALAQRWPKGQRNPIPIVVFFDAQFNEIGHWIERTASCDALRQALKDAHPSLEGRAFSQIAAPKMYDAFKTHLWRDVLAEWRAALSVESAQPM